VSTPLLATHTHNCTSEVLSLPPRKGLLGIWNAEVGESLQAWGQPRPYSETLSWKGECWKKGKGKWAEGSRGVRKDRGMGYCKHLSPMLTNTAIAFINSMKSPNVRVHSHSLNTHTHTHTHTPPSPTPLPSLLPSPGLCLPLWHMDIVVFFLFCFFGSVKNP